ncbi:MAG: fused MFS/spermidine synthase [Acidobacteriota bacterium]
MTLFFVSGATGLLYEVLFSRLLHLFVGSTVHALTTVLTTFMGGLGLGAFLGGRRAARFPDPLRAYAVCELLIGVLAASVPLQLRLFDPLFALVHADPTRPLLLRTLGSFGLCAIVLLPPTALMGATLPILTEALARGTLRVGRAAGWLYAFNTFGAFAGALLAGFVLIPAAGQTATLLAGALTNATLFAIVWRLPSRAAPVPPVAGPATATPTVQMIVAGTALAASGFAAMVFQVGWTRVAAMSLGSSTYTFSLVVAAFIFGLAAGAAAMARWADALRAPLAVFAAIEIGIGASALGVMPAFGRFPTMAYELIGAHHGSFGGLLVVELGTLFLLVSLPTLLMGGLFPLAARLMHTGKGTGRAAGLAYSVNTIGSILGAFLAGFVLIPKLGNQGSLAAAAALEVAAGAFLLLFPWPPTPRRGAALAALVLLSVPVARALPRWDRAILISAPYLQNPDYHDLLKEVDAGRERGMREGASSHLLFYRDDPFVNVAVVSVGDGLNLKLNGKADASTFQDMATQRLVAYLPLLLHGAPEHVCVVGMGSGVTAGCASVFPGVKSVDILEIAQGVIDASRFFGGVNHLPRPNARVLMADGRLHLRYARSTYDVIVSEPSNPWVAGEASLFSVEYFAEARRRLDPRHGVMSAWLQTYRMSREAVRTVLRSFQASFPAMTVWTAAPGDLILVGAASDVRLDLDRAAARIGDPALLPDMQALGIGEPSDLVAHLALAPGDVSRVTSGGTERHTDDNGWLEWEAPRFVLASENVLLASEVAPPASVSALPFAISGGEEARRRLDAAMPGIATARALAFAAEDAQESGNVGEAERECRAALASYAREPLAAMVLADALSARARDLSRRSHAGGPAGRSRRSGRSRRATPGSRPGSRRRPSPSGEGPRLSRGPSGSRPLSPTTRRSATTMLWRRSASGERPMRSLSSRRRGGSLRTMTRSP